MFLYLLCKVVLYFTAKDPRKLIDGSISTIFSHKGQKEELGKRVGKETQAQVFSC